MEYLFPPLEKGGVGGFKEEMPLFFNKISPDPILSLSKDGLLLFA
jgi:hypothetical protein